MIELTSLVQKPILHRSTDVRDSWFASIFRGNARHELDVFNIRLDAQMADTEDPKGNVAPVIPPKPVEAKAEPVVKPQAQDPKPVAAAVEPKSPPSAPVKAPVTTEAPVKPVEAKAIEAKAKPAAKVAPAKAAPSKTVVAAKPVAPEPVVAKPPVLKALKPKISKPKIQAAPAKPKPAPAVVPAKAAPVQAVVTKPAIKVAEEIKEAVPAAPASKVATPKAAPKTAPKPIAGKPVFAGLFSNFMLEETTMDMSANFTGFQDAVTEAQAKAKAAFEKGTSVLGEVSDFAKGNVEAAVESGKIYAEGVQALGSEFVTESRAAFEKISGDIKELAAAKSPTDFFKLQGDLARKNFDTAVAYSSKNSEAVLKLFSDTFAPISGRVSIAVEKARSAASL
ncbi:TIGR01841 family phasin [Novosphingobium resinovorum]|uniref:phasin family protein n=1 Tax=Novosphingobium resinovorum TaxID=158500 RepID=UPI002ED1F24B|nr:TIGR01841 family phasin [Novosphingobium resinovorum]